MLPGTLAADDLQTLLETRQARWLILSGIALLAALLGGVLLAPRLRSGLLAIARLTFSEGVRMRIVLVFLIVLGFLMVQLPFALRGDQTLSGRLQSFLDYSLGALSIFMSLATIFLACHTLADEVRTRSLHLVVTKPVSRFQILLGKWLGVCLLNLLIVVLCGTAIYGFAQFIRNQAPLNERDRVKLRDAVWTARVGARPTPPEFKEDVDAFIEQRIEEGVLQREDEAQIRTLKVERLKELNARWRVVPPSFQEQIFGRVYLFENLPAPAREDEIVQVSFKARAIPLPPNEQLRIQWVFVDPDTAQPLHPPLETLERSGDKHEFFVRAGAFAGGKAALAVVNPPSERSQVEIHFEGDDSLEILYRVGSFELNYVKTLAILFMRLAFLGAIGVFFSAFVSFPVAAFCVLSVYLVCLAKPWLLEAVGANIEMYTESIDPYGGWWGKPIRFVLVPIMKVFFPDFTNYDGSSKLIDGMHIPLSLMGFSILRLLAFGGIVLLLGGWAVFRRREVAEVTV